MDIRLGTVVLAAGKGTRMHSDIPKVMQPMLGEPMLRYVFDALEPLSPALSLTVVGYGADIVKASFAERTSFVVQERQLGTGHALQTAWPEICKSSVSHILVVNGDTPLIATNAMSHFIASCIKDKADVAFLSLFLDDAGSFGRVVRKDGIVTAIVEAKDYDEAVHGPCPREINSGIYFLCCEAIASLLPRLTNKNKSGEFYITDLIEMAVEHGKTVSGIQMGNDLNLLGVNTPVELVAAEEILRARLVLEAMETGVFIHASSSVRIGPDVRIEGGASITGPCELYKKCRVARGAQIASHCFIEDSEIRSGAVVNSFCHIVGAVIAEECVTGPFSRLRPGTVLEKGAHTGSFVELKNSHLGEEAKANHLAYIGDAYIGAGTNIGAGVITCNYDGKNKHPTIIGENAFVGSNASLVAPVRIGKNAFVGAGSVITKDVPEEHLGIGRARQTNMPWKKNN